MIENYLEKRKNKQVDFEFAESGNLTILERRFDEVTGLPVLKATTETNSQHIRDLLADVERQMEPFLKRKADLEAMLPDVEKKEAEREKLIAAKDKAKAVKK